MTTGLAESRALYLDHLKSRKGPLHPSRREKNVAYELLSLHPELREKSEEEIDAREAELTEARRRVELVQEKNWNAWHRRESSDFQDARIVAETGEPNSGWNQYSINDGTANRKTKITPKLYITLKDYLGTSGLTKHLVNRLLKDLADAGFNGQLKVPDNPKAWKRFDHIVIHAESMHQLMEIALPIARKATGPRALEITTGFDVPGLSHTEFDALVLRLSRGERIPVHGGSDLAKAVDALKDEGVFEIQDGVLVKINDRREELAWASR